jgi:hypothetical protein
MLTDLIRRAMDAQVKGNQTRANMYYDIYQTAREQPPCDNPQPNSAKRDRSPEKSEDNEDIGAKPNAGKANEDSEDKLVVGELKFISGAVPKHDEMGFTPFFNKNIRELKGPLPLTIFNKALKNAAILYHSEKRAKLEDTVGDRNQYTGFPFPSKWTQMFAEWTTNHQGFYQALVGEYGY